MSANPYAALQGSALDTLAQPEAEQGFKSPSQHENFGGGPSNKLTYKQATGALLRRLIASLALYRMKLLLAAGCALLSALTALILPLLVARALDLIAEGQASVPKLVPLVLLLALFALSSAMLSCLRDFFASQIARGSAYTLRRDLRAKLSRIELSYFDQHSAGDTTARLMNDVEQVSDALLRSISGLSDACMRAVIALVCMLSLNPAMAGIVCVLAPCSLVVSVLLGRSSRSSFDEQQARAAQLAAVVDEHITELKLISAFGQQEMSRQSFEKHNDELYKVGERAQFISSLANPASRFVNKLLYAAVAGLAFAAYAGTMPFSLSLGAVQAFLSYTEQLTTPLAELTGIIPQLEVGLASAARIFELMDVGEMSEVVTPSQDSFAKYESLSLAAHEVSFSYLPHTEILHQINFELDAGHKLALVGPTGCGKTTLINLILRFYEPDAGSIELMGTDISSIARPELRRQVGMVLQDSWLFEGTVAQNIAYARADASRDEIVAIAKLCHADEFIQKLPQGYDTLISDEAQNISQGQKQLICIARAMLANRKLLVLDEATSAIDMRTELLINQAFDQLIEGRSSLVVAHRLSTIQSADTILYMQDGRIIEQGSHAELMAHNGAYARLYKAQFK